MKFLIEVHGPWTRENKPDYLNLAGKRVAKPIIHEYNSFDDAHEAAMIYLNKLKGNCYTVTPA